MSLFIYFQFFHPAPQPCLEILQTLQWCGDWVEVLRFSRVLIENDLTIYPQKLVLKSCRDMYIYIYHLYDMCILIVTNRRMFVNDTPPNFNGVIQRGFQTWVLSASMLCQFFPELSSFAGADCLRSAADEWRRFIRPLLKETVAEAVASWFYHVHFWGKNQFWIIFFKLVETTSKFWMTVDEETSAGEAVYLSTRPKSIKSI